MALHPAHRTPQPGTPGRRSLLLGAAAVGVGAAGCSSGTKSSSATSTAAASSSAASPAGSPTSAGASPSPSTSASPSSSPSPALPAAVPWRPGPSEVEPAAKLAAVRLIEAFGTWKAGQGGTRQAATRATALGITASLATKLAGETGALTPAADEAVVQVVDAQYGGILTDSASVLVVCTQTTRTGTAVQHGGTTVDVRLSRTSAGWGVTVLHPATPGPATSLSTTARAVLSNSRIQLPPASAADIRSGAVHSSVLRAMTQLAGAYRISVSVVRSGHPIDVFGTTRPSDHPLGRAFDVWQISGHRVVDPATSRTLITDFMRAAAAAGSYNVGGPVQLSGGATANQFFSDATHHDHVHIGFTT